MKKSLNLPRFRNANEESSFFSQLDLSEYFEPSDFHRTQFPNLKPPRHRASVGQGLCELVHIG